MTWRTVEIVIAGRVDNFNFFNFFNFWKILLNDL